MYGDGFFFIIVLNRGLVLIPMSGYLASVARYELMQPINKWYGVFLLLIGRYLHKAHSI